MAPPSVAAWGASTRASGICASVADPAIPGFRPSLAARIAAAFISAGENPFLSARVFFFAGGSVCGMLGGREEAAFRQTLAQRVEVLGADSLRARVQEV